MIANKDGKVGIFYCKTENNDNVWASIRKDGWHVEHVLVNSKPSERVKKYIEGIPVYCAHQNAYTQMLVKARKDDITAEFFCKTQDKDIVFKMLTENQGWIVEHVLDGKEPSESGKAWLIRSIFYSPYMFHLEDDSDFYAAGEYLTEEDVDEGEEFKVICVRSVNSPDEATFFLMVEVSEDEPYTLKVSKASFKDGDSHVPMEDEWYVKQEGKFVLKTVTTTN